MRHGTVSYASMAITLLIAMTGPIRGTWYTDEICELRPRYEARIPEKGSLWRI